MARLGGFGPGRLGRGGSDSDLELAARVGFDPLSDPRAASGRRRILGASLCAVLGEPAFVGGAFAFLRGVLVEAGKRRTGFTATTESGCIQRSRRPIRRAL